MSSPDAQRPVVGIALMAFASLLVPIVDGIAKLLSSSLSPFYISFARYFVATTIVLLLAPGFAENPNWDQAESEVQRTPHHHDSRCDDLLLLRHSRNTTSPPHSAATSLALSSPPC